jgi:hypothetical protein
MNVKIFAAILVDKVEQKASFYKIYTTIFSMKKRIYST